MTDVATPQATRLRRPSWRDSRLVVGLLLVLASTALGGWVVSRADDTTPVYAAQRALVPGQPLGAGDVRRVDVRLGDGAAAYLSATKELPADLHVLRALGPGELIPAGAVGGTESVDTRVVAVQVDTTTIAALDVGSLVDVYVNKPTGATGPGGRPEYAGPERTLERAAVAALPSDEGGVLGGVSGLRPVQLVVPAADVQELVAAIDLGSRITLVPAPGQRTGSP